MTVAARSIPEPIVREHIARLLELMRAQDLAAVLLFDQSNMLAFAGVDHASSDRITCAAVTREGQVVVICPTFERPAAAGGEGLATIHTWEEHEDPYACFSRAVRRAGVRSGTFGVDGRIWLAALERFQQVFDGMTFRSADNLLREVRLCKTPAEQALLRAAHRKGERVFLVLRDMLRPGVREIDLAKEIFAHFEPDGLRIMPMLQSGPNAAVPHNPTGGRALQDGDMLVCDSVIRWDGYTNDLTRTYALGRPTARMKKAYHAVRQAQAAAFEAARAGVPCRRLDEVARQVITQAGFGPYFAHRLGHGIGIECHEPPYLDGGNDELLRPGMCTTVEPGVYVPGEFGIRIEDDIIITEDGCEVIRGNLPTDVTDAFDR